MSDPQNLHSSDDQPGGEGPIPGMIPGSQPTEPLLPPPDGPEPEIDWEQRYERERRRSRLFLVTTLGAVVLLIGSVFWAGATDRVNPLADVVDDSPWRGLGPGFGDRSSGERGPGGHGRGRFGPHHDGRGAGEGRFAPDPADRFFEDDGSLNEEAVERAKRMLAGSGGRGAERLNERIDHAVEEGDISAQQAEALKKALAEEVEEEETDASAA